MSPCLQAIVYLVTDYMKLVIWRQIEENGRYISGIPKVKGRCNRNLQVSSRHIYTMWTVQHFSH